MCSYESDVHKLRCKLNDNYQSVIVSFDIEYIMLISYIIHTIECLFYVCEAFPFAMFDNRDPFLDSNLGIRMFFYVFL